MDVTDFGVYITLRVVPFRTEHIDTLVEGGSVALMQRHLDDTRRISELEREVCHKDSVIELLMWQLSLQGQQAPGGDSDCDSPRSEKSVVSPVTPLFCASPTGSVGSLCDMLLDPSRDGDDCVSVGSALSATDRFD